MSFFYIRRENRIKEIFRSNRRFNPFLPLLAFTSVRVSILPNPPNRTFPSSSPPHEMFIGVGAHHRFHFWLRSRCHRRSALSSKRFEDGAIPATLQQQVRLRMDHWHTSSSSYTKSQSLWRGHQIKNYECSSIESTRYKSNSINCKIEWKSRSIRIVMIESN